LSSCHGVARALNVGFSRARGELIARMDADDIALPGRIEEQVAAMREHEDIDVLGTAVEIFQTDEDEVARCGVVRAGTMTSASSNAGDAAIIPTATSSSAVTTSPLTSAPTTFPPTPALLEKGKRALTNRVITHPSAPFLCAFHLPLYCPLAHPTVMIRRRALERLRVMDEQDGMRWRWSDANEHQKHSATANGNGNVMPIPIPSGPYSHSWLHVEDYELWMRMTRRGMKIANVCIPGRGSRRGVGLMNISG